MCNSNSVYSLYLNYLILRAVLIIHNDSHQGVENDFLMIAGKMYWKNMGNFKMKKRKKRERVFVFKE